MADEKKALRNLASQDYELKLQPNQTIGLAFDPPVNGFKAMFNNSSGEPGVVKVTCEERTVSIPAQVTITDSFSCPNTTDTYFTNESQATILVRVSAM